MYLQWRKAVAMAVKYTQQATVLGTRHLASTALSRHSLDVVTQHYYTICIVAVMYTKVYRHVF